MSNIPFTPSRESSEFEFVSGKDEASTSSKQNPSPSSSIISNNDVPAEGLFGWVRGSGGLLSKVAEKTKSSVETVITTLDPQMKGNCKYSHYVLNNIFWKWRSYGTKHNKTQKT